MAFPLTGILDDFNRADENPLSGGGNWSFPVRSGTDHLDIVSTKAVGHTAGVDNESYWTAATFGPDSEAWVKIPTLPADGEGVNLYTRLTSPGGGSQTTYLLNVFKVAGGGNDAWTMYKCVSGAFTIIGSATQEIATADGIGLETIGTAIKGYLFTGGAWNASPIVSVSDGAVTGTGKLGLGIFKTTAQLTPFGGGTVPVGLDDLGWLAVPAQADPLVSVY